MTESKEEIVKTEEDKPVKIRAFPEICAFTNDEGNGFDIEISLPGVERDTIDLKMNKEYITIFGETETVNYTGSYQFCCPVDPDKAVSTYKEGLLKIHVPFKEPELHNIEIKVE